MTETLSKVELELFERMGEACEEVEFYVRERWSESLYGVDFDMEGKAVVVTLSDFDLRVDEADIENIRRMIERHGLTVDHYVVSVKAGDLADAVIRFYVALV